LAVDLHAHWIPPILASALRKRRAAPRIERRNGGDTLVTFLGSRPFERVLVDLDIRRRFMRRHGIAAQMLSLAGLFGVDCLPTEESVPLVTAFNDAASDACRADPRTFVALAALPLADVPLASRELERAHAIGLRGAILPADGFVTRAEAERFRPLFESGNQLRSHFFVHPGPVKPQPELESHKAQKDNAWQRYIVLETQARLSAVVTTLELSDYLQPFPNVTVQVANLGGAIPFLAERMDEVSRVEARGEPLPSRRMRRCYVDTASFGPRAVELAAACFGADRVVLGTDCPVFGAERMLKSVAEARLDSKSRDQLLFGNAQRLLGIRANQKPEFLHAT
jgi:predicted TIM-barrel fold metal-dependent hydrolase